MCCCLLEVLDTIIEASELLISMFSSWWRTNIANDRIYLFICGMAGVYCYSYSRVSCKSRERVCMFVKAVNHYFIHVYDE